jgi:hypothetical protein
MAVSRSQLPAGHPVAFGEPPTLGQKFIALDIEYEIIGRRIWLIGVGIVDGADIEHGVIWAEYADNERQALVDLADLVAGHPETKIVTWAGITADMPALCAAAHRHGLQEALAPVFDRHFDRYAHAGRTVRFPIPELRLKDISSYLDLDRASVVTDGFNAVQLYGRMGGSPTLRRGRYSTPASPTAARRTSTVSWRSLAASSEASPRLSCHKQHGADQSLLVAPPSSVGKDRPRIGGRQCAPWRRGRLTGESASPAERLERDRLQA